MTTSLQDIPLTDITGKPSSLAAYDGKVLLVVNVASKCGLTPQYEALENLYKKYEGEGFAVLGFPANDFGEQEPGSNAEIAEFCTTNFGVAFPMFEKIVVSGPDKHPLYSALTEAMPSKQGDTEAFRSRLRDYGMTPNEDPEVLWNFEKFLIDRAGNVVERFAPDMAPDAPQIVSAIEERLALEG